MKVLEVGKVIVTCDNCSAKLETDKYDWKNEMGQYYCICPECQARVYENEIPYHWKQIAERA